MTEESENCERMGRMLPKLSALADPGQNPSVGERTSAQEKLGQISDNCPSLSEKIKGFIGRFKRAESGKQENSTTEETKNQEPYKFKNNNNTIEKSLSSTQNIAKSIEVSTAQTGEEKPKSIGIEGESTKPKRFSGLLDSGKNFVSGVGSSLVGAAKNNLLGGIQGFENVLGKKESNKGDIFNTKFGRPYIFTKRRIRGAFESYLFNIENLLRRIAGKSAIEGGKPGGLLEKAKEMVSQGAGGFLKSLVGSIIGTLAASKLGKLMLGAAGALGLRGFLRKPKGKTFTRKQIRKRARSIGRARRSNRFKKIGSGIRSIPSKIGKGLSVVGKGLADAGRFIAVGARALPVLSAVVGVFTGISEAFSSTEKDIERFGRNRGIMERTFHGILAGVTGFGDSLLQVLGITDKSTVEYLDELVQTEKNMNRYRQAVQKNKQTSQNITASTQERVEQDKQTGVLGQTEIATANIIDRKTSRRELTDPETGELRDIEKKQEAYQDASAILVNFKNLLESYKEVARTPEGSRVLEQEITPRALNMWNSYTEIMRQAGLDPETQAPGEAYNYAPILKKISDNIKSAKSKAYRTSAIQAAISMDPALLQSANIQPGSISQVSIENIGPSTTPRTPSSDIQSLAEPERMTRAQELRSTTIENNYNTVNNYNMPMVDNRQMTNVTNNQTGSDMPARPMKSPDETLPSTLTRFYNNNQYAFA
jgi:hypothetical protein